jgi:hypothetical protein
MAVDQSYDSKLQPTDRSADSNSSSTAAAQWQDRGSWRNAMNSMQPNDSSAGHLPNFSIDDSASDSIKNAYETFKNSGPGGVPDLKDALGTLNADIKSIQDDLLSLNNALDSYASSLKDSGAAPDSQPSSTSPDGSVSKPPSDATQTPSDAQPGDVATAKPSHPGGHHCGHHAGGHKPDQSGDTTQPQPGDGTPTTSPSDTLPSSPVTPPGDVTTPTQPGTPPGDVTTPTQPGTPPGDVTTPTQPDTPPGDVTTPTQPGTPPGDVIPPTKPVTTGDTTPRTPGTPFASDSIFNLPLGTGAQWMRNDQLSNAGVYINTVGNYNENIYTSTANDPLVTVTNDAASGGEPSTFQVHIPVGAVAAGGNDKTFTVHDTATNTWDSFGGFNWTGDNTATVSQGSNEPFDGSGLTQDHSNWDEGVGTLTQADLQAGTIDHMLRMELPMNMLFSYDKNNTNNLAPFAYPQTQEDGFANNGNGGPIYTGTIPYGVTIGIPQGTPEPADVAANPGAHMLWTALQTHGAMVRDSGGNDNNVIFQADQNVDPNDPLIQAMNNYGKEIMSATQILSNQGPDSVNGGGTPVVPLIASL